MGNQDLHEIDGYDHDHKQTNDDDDDAVICSICRRGYSLSELDDGRRQRLEQAKKRKSDFGMEGGWHCPVCAISPLSIYTTWISLSELSAPKDSILTIVPRSH